MTNLYLKLCVSFQLLQHKDVLWNDYTLSIFNEVLTYIVRMSPFTSMFSSVLHWFLSSRLSKDWKVYKWNNTTKGVVDSFHPNVPFSYYPKNRRFSDVFRGREMGHWAEMGLTTFWSIFHHQRVILKPIWHYISNARNSDTDHKSYVH